VVKGNHKNCFGGTTSGWQGCGVDRRARLHAPEQPVPGVRWLFLYP